MDGKRSSVMVGKVLSEMSLPCDLGERGSAQDNAESDVAPAVSRSRGGLGSVGNGPTSMQRKNRRMLGLPGHQPSGAKVLP